MPIGVQCPISSSLGEFPSYWDWLWRPGLSPYCCPSPFPSPSILSASDWFKAKTLSLNLNKTNYIIFRSTNKQISSTTKEINIDNVIMPRVVSTKFLGVYVDQHLKWNIHIEEFSKKISKNISIIKRISHLLPKQTLKLLYYALIHPYLTYCNCIWSSTYITHLTQLTTLQKSYTCHNQITLQYSYQTTI